MSPNSTIHASVEPDEPREPPDDREDTDDYLDLILDRDETPEEAGYGHGV